MKIAIIGPLSPWRGGIAKYLDSLAVALEQQTNHVVDRFTFSRQYPSRYRVTTDEVANDGLAVIDILNPLSWAKTARMFETAAEWDVAYDLVIFKYWHPAFAPVFGYLADKLHKSGAKICFVVDNVYPHEWFPFSKSLARYCLQNGDLFITHSKTVTDKLIKLLPMSFVRQVSHPAYDYGKKDSKKSSRLNLKILPDKKIVLFFGYIRPYKGLDVLLHAFTITNAWFPDSVLLVAGEPREKMSRYKDLAKALGIGNKIIWHDHYIPEKQVQLYISAADLLVLPYKQTTQSGVAEIARAFELPIIATAVGGLPEQIECTVPPNNFEALARAMVRFFTDSIACGYKPTITFEELAKEVVKNV